MMIRRLVLAAVAGAIAFLVCILLGMLLSATGIPIAVTIGAFLETWAGAIAILVAVAHFFGGINWP
jgi:hypothetical protein